MAEKKKEVNKKKKTATPRPAATPPPARRDRAGKSRGRGNDCHRHVTVTPSPPTLCELGPELSAASGSYKKQSRRSI